MTNGPWTYRSTVPRWLRGDVYKRQTDDRERLRGLSKEHAENIGLHILAAYTLEERDPELALEHAKGVRGV